jgi:hypothetical protein
MTGASEKVVFASLSDSGRQLLASPTAVAA